MCCSCRFWPKNKKKWCYARPPPTAFCPFMTKILAIRPCMGIFIPTIPPLYETLLYLRRMVNLYPFGWLEKHYWIFLCRLHLELSRVTRQFFFAFDFRQFTYQTLTPTSSMNLMVLLSSYLPVELMNDVSDNCWIWTTKHWPLLGLDCAVIVGGGGGWRRVTTTAGRYLQDKELCFLIHNRLHYRHVQVFCHPQETTTGFYTFQ
jgi:hypothetical protein